MEWHRSQWFYSVVGTLIAVGVLAGAAICAEQSSCIEPTSRPGPNTAMSKFNSSITDVGIARAPANVGGAQYHLSGTFVLDPGVTLNLGASRVTFEQFMYEDLTDGGFGELVVTVDRACFVPLTLAAQDGGQPDKALFQDA